MSLTTEEVIGGMYRAHRAGQPFAALMANPHFASLPLEQKKDVLQGLRQRMSGESTSAVNAITTVLKNMAGGALGAVPLGIAIPMGLEMAENGTKNSVLAALRMASQNKNVKMLIGTGAAIGAAGGLINAALGLNAARKDRAALQEGLAATEKGGEDLSTALFGGIGGHRSAPRFSTEAVTKALGVAATPSILASARLGHLDAVTQPVDHAYNSALGKRVYEKMQQGYSADPDRLDALKKQMANAQGPYAAMNDLVVNSQRDLNIDPDVSSAISEDIVSAHGQNDQNIKHFNALTELARHMRDIKRGVQ